MMRPPVKVQSYSRTEISTDLKEYMLFLSANIHQYKLTYMMADVAREWVRSNHRVVFDEGLELHQTGHLIARGHDYAWTTMVVRRGPGFSHFAAWAFDLRSDSSVRVTREAKQVLYCVAGKEIV